MAGKGGTVQGHSTGKRGKKDMTVRKHRPFYYYYYTICMSPVTGISSWYFS